MHGSCSDVKLVVSGITGRNLAEGKAAGAEYSDSDADSCAKRGSPDNYEELKSQTQRILRGDLAVSKLTKQA